MPLTVDEAIPQLVELLTKDKLCIFAGSGVSVPSPSCLPTWDGFVDKYISICAEVNQIVCNDYKFDDILQDAER